MSVAVFFQHWQEDSQHFSLSVLYEGKTQELHLKPGLCLLLSSINVLFSSSFSVEGETTGACQSAVLSDHVLFSCLSRRGLSI